jgi:hypothetical protein
MRIGAYAAAIAALLLVSTGPRGAETLPAAIDDATFWKLIEDASEPTGVFPSENFTSNENGFQMIIPALQAATKPGGVYLGVGPEQNFTYIAALKPKIAFIVDIRRQNLIQHLYYKAAFELAENRADFLAVIFGDKRPEKLADTAGIEEMLAAYSTAETDDAIYAKNLQAIKDVLMTKHKFALSAEDQLALDHVATVFNYYGPQLNYSSVFPISSGGRGGSSNSANFTTVMTATDPQQKQRGFLASEENFRVLKDLEAKNLLIPIVGDFGGPKALRAVGRYLKDRGATVTAFYTSNVEQYLFNATSGNRGRVVNGGATNFYENVGTLPLDANSVFIRSGVPAANGGRGNGMNNSQIAPIQATVNAYKADKINQYGDIFSISK